MRFLNIYTASQKFGHTRLLLFIFTGAEPDERRGLNVLQIRVQFTSFTDKTQFLACAK